MTKPLVNNPDNLISEPKDDPISLTQVVVTEISELFDEQYMAVIYASIETRLLEDVPDYRSLKQTPVYEALMAALDQYEENPFKDLCIGFSESDPLVSADLRVYYNPDDEDIFTDWDLPERHFEAVVYHEFD